MPHVLPYDWRLSLKWSAESISLKIAFVSAIEDSTCEQRGDIP